MPGHVSILAIIGFTATAAYAGFLLALSVGFRRTVSEAFRVPKSGDPGPAISVIIPARNEAPGIEAVLRRVFASRYPDYEVIVVDDASTDGTGDLVRAAPQFGGGSLHLIQLAEPEPGTRATKKRAIEAGVALASGEWILQTDADGSPGERWIEGMATYFQADTDFVAGPVAYPSGTTFFERFQALEFLGFAGIAAGSIGLGRPILCSGANMAFRKSAFVVAGGHGHSSHLTSGDDELLMQRIQAETAGRVRYCADPEALVLTDAMPTLASFLEQRRRWASKGAHYPARRLIGINLVIFGAFAFLVAGVPWSIANPSVAPYVAGGFVLKVLGEAVLLAMVTRHFGRSALMRYLLPSQPLEIAYIVAASVAGVWGRFEWKGRRFDR
ncbi:MAG: cellulose synthase/poly-beta-1,6-N-acetylglucosamine synthase-like glycosyltransferase [Rhodothermales bacterium]|jgi:cellulose synthase/poly-beta-1,6-N-acetylglucosamine synthase-like glycosyltransferase